MITEEFRAIPYFRDYEINKEGTVRNVTTKKICTFRFSGKNKVRSVNMVSSRGDRTSRTISGLLEEAFKNE
jgi:hypothetical protein